MREVVICEPVRTPIGRYGGSLQPLSAAELGEIALRGLLERTGLDPAAVDNVVLGHCYPNSEAPAIGRPGRAQRGPAGDGAGHAGRPALRLRAAVGAPGRDASEHRRG